MSLIIGLSSCGKWLDVTPEDEIVEKDLYAEATGAHNVLNGLYKSMAKPSLYGTELTFGLVDALGQVYNLENTDGFYGDGLNNYSPYYRAARFEYKYDAGIKNMIASVWENQYKVIINANNLIFNIASMPTTKFQFGKEEKEMIQGEAYAVRALCHFDLLRLYAPAPAMNSQNRYIHYSVESDVNKPGFITNPLTVDETLKLIEKDLLLAKNLVTPYDTLNAGNKERLSSAYRFQIGMQSGDMFYKYRGYRLNAIAINALLARMYNYWGKHEEATKYANDVINFKYDESSKALSFAGGREIAKDRKFKSDLIFCLSYPKLMVDYTNYANSTSNSVLTIKFYEELFVNYEFQDAADYRFKYLFKVADSWYNECYPLKNTPYEENSIYEDMVPIVRLSEMYFILADAYAAKGDFTNAQNSINEVRKGRNCKTVNLGMNDMDTYKKRYFEEFRREFFQEGQIFFNYKKHNVLMTKKMSVESFIIPIPESQNI